MDNYPEDNEVEEFEAAVNPREITNKLSYITTKRNYLISTYEFEMFFNEEDWIVWNNRYSVIGYNHFGKK